MKSEHLQRIDLPIVLVGMMGAGKSHMGRALSRALAVELYDSDKIIEEKAGRSIPEIFEEFGEEKFRISEKNTILELLENGKCVIATGGGAVTNSDTLSAMKEKGLVIWLSAELDTLWDRVSRTSHRPLLQKENPKQILFDLLQQRETYYAQAHIKFDSGRYKDEKAGDIALQDMLKAINEYFES